MTKVTVQPDGIEYEAEIGQSIMGAAQKSGYYWPTTCGGNAICTTCMAEVVSGTESLSDMDEIERDTIVDERGSSILETPVRLACQATLIADTPVTVRKYGVVPASQAPTMDA